MAREVEGMEGAIGQAQQGAIHVQVVAGVYEAQAAAAADAHARCAARGDVEHLKHGGGGAAKDFKKQLPRTHRELQAGVVQQGPATARTAPNLALLKPYNYGAPLRDFRNTMGFTSRSAVRV
jgi:hypothetical protein